MFKNAKISLLALFFISVWFSGCAGYLESLKIIEQRESKKISELEKNIRLNPGSAEAHHSLGIFLYSIGRYQEAKRELNESIRIKPDDPDMLFDFSNICDELNDGKTAITKMIASEKIYGSKNDRPGQVMARNKLRSYYSKYDYQPEDFGQEYPAILDSPYSTNPTVERTAKEPSPQSGTGSGFFVSKMGHVITNAHVVRGCNKVTIGDNANKQVSAEVINEDSSNDLALLKLSTLEMTSVDSKSLIQKLSIAVVPLASKGLLRAEDVRLGEKVLVAGYPFGDFFSTSIKVTTGVVSSTRGAGDDSGQFQLDAAVQPGNSGGPIYDSGGNIVGVIISQLDKLKVAKAIGSLPENVNFGIKASTVRQFLMSSGLPSKKAEQTEEKSTEQLAEIAQNQALMVRCLQ